MWFFKFQIWVKKSKSREYCCNFYISSFYSINISSAFVSYLKRSLQVNFLSTCSSPFCKGNAKSRTLYKVQQTPDLEWNWAKTILPDSSGQGTNRAYSITLIISYVFDTSNRSGGDFRIGNQSMVKTNALYS